MKKRLMCLFIASLFFYACSSNQPKESDNEVKACCQNPNAKQTDHDSSTNDGLIQWAEFFKEFSEDMGERHAVLNRIKFPIEIDNKTIDSIDFISNTKHNMFFPQSFQALCQQANDEVKKELMHFETNKLFKFPNNNDGDFKLLIEFTEDKVLVTHLEKRPNDKKGTVKWNYTFRTIHGQYKLVSITESQ